MAKENRGGKRAGGGITIGDDKISFDGTLKYGKDNLAETVRKNIENWEKKRVKNKIEYAIVLDANGNVIGTEIKGGKSSAKIPASYTATPNSIMSHVHPRGSGVLGGTFSYADVRSFANNNLQTIRATAKEGTYSMSKTPKFNKDGFKQYAQEVEKRVGGKLKEARNTLQTDVFYGKLNSVEANKRYNKAFNNALVELHNAYRDG